GEVLQRRLVEGQARLISAVGNAWRTEVDPGGHRGAAGKDEPEASDTVDVRERIDECEQAHHAADCRAAEAEQAFLIARADGRQRYHEAGDLGGIVLRIVETVAQDVVDQGGQRAPDGKLHVLGSRHVLCYEEM